MTTTACGFTIITPQQARTLLDQGKAVLFDIRDPAEYARQHISGARLVPLASLDTHDFDRERSMGVAAIFQCQSGRRTEANAARLVGTGFRETYVIQGGLNGWRAAGLPVHVDASQPIELQRQVQIAAGSLVLTGVVLAAVLSPWFVLLSAFVGGGLVFAGISGSCAMAQVLMQMPWNRRRSAAT